MNNPVLKEILELIDVEAIEENLFRGQNHDTEHVFGGQVLAQALTAAYRTVVTDHELHSLHAYFLRPGDWTRPILYEVDRIRDGRSFTPVYSSDPEWPRQSAVVGVAAKRRHQPMPNVPPESLRGDLEAYRDAIKQQPDVARFSFHLRRSTPEQ